MSPTFCHALLIVSDLVAAKIRELDLHAQTWKIPQFWSWNRGEMTPPAVTGWPTVQKSCTFCNFMFFSFVIIYYIIGLLKRMFVKKEDINFQYSSRWDLQFRLARPMAPKAKISANHRRRCAILFGGDEIWCSPVSDYLIGSLYHYLQLYIPVWRRISKPSIFSHDAAFLQRVIDEVNKPDDRSTLQKGCDVRRREDTISSPSHLASSSRKMACPFATKPLKLWKVWFFMPNVLKHVRTVALVGQGQ